MQLSLEVRDSDDASRAFILNREREFLDVLLKEGPPGSTYALVTLRAIEMARQAWQAEGQQDDHSS